jgi:hypothetical protein
MESTFNPLYLHPDTWRIAYLSRGLGYLLGLTVRF